MKTITYIPRSLEELKIEFEKWFKDATYQDYIIFPKKRFERFFEGKK